MVKITYAPWKEVVIHEVMEYTFDELIHTQAIGVPTGGIGMPLLWAEGVLFNRAIMPMSPEMIKEGLEGRVHFAGVLWAKMPQFRNFVEIKETKVRIPVVDVTANELFSELVKWLKKTAKSV